MNCKKCNKKCEVPSWKICDTCSRCKRHKVYDRLDYSKIAEGHIILERGNETEYDFQYNDTPKCKTCRMELHDWIGSNGKKHTAPLLFCDSTCERIGRTYHRMFGLYKR